MKIHLATIHLSPPIGRVRPTLGLGGPSLFAGTSYRVPALRTKKPIGPVRAAGHHCGRAAPHQREELPPIHIVALRPGTSARAFAWPCQGHFPGRRKMRLAAEIRHPVEQH